MYSNKAKYKETADKVMHSLSSSDYRSKIGENHNFLLMHSVGSYPHGNEIDVPLIYADYYFLDVYKRQFECIRNKIINSFLHLFGIKPYTDIITAFFKIKSDLALCRVFQKQQVVFIYKMNHIVFADFDGHMSLFLFPEIQ